MKRVGLLAILTLLFVGIWGIGGWVRGHDFRSGDSVTIAQSQKIGSTLFTSGRNIDIAGEIDGDVYCAGQTVQISATVKGDVLCAAQTLRITGTVEGDIRIAAQTANVGGDVRGSASVAAQSYTLESGGKIGRDVSVGATDVVLNGSVGRDVAIAAGNVTLAGQIGRDVQARISELRLASAANIGGGIDYTGPNRLTRDPGAQVAGRVDYSPQKRTEEGRFKGLNVGFMLYGMLALILIALVLALLFPRLLHAAADFGLARPWVALLVGFLANAAMPFVLIALFLTVIGIPLALLLGLVWLLIFLLSGPVAAYYLGRLLLRGSRKPVLIMLLGSFVLILLYLVPVLNFFVFLAAVWLGTGMILSASFRRLPRPEFVLAEEAAVTPQVNSPKPRKRRASK